MSKSYKLEEVDFKGQNGSANGTYKTANGASNAVAPTEEEEKKPEQKPMVGSMEVFRFSTGLDKVLIAVGFFASCAHGAIMPIMMIVFGSMADTFIDNGRFNQFWDEYGPNITYFTNITKDELLKDPNKFRIVCNLTQSPYCDEVIKTIQSNFDGKMNEYVIYYTIIGCVTFVISYIQLVCWNLSSYRQCQKIRTLLFQRILRQEIGWFDTHEVGELNTRLADDVSKIQEGLGEKFGLFFQWLCSFLAGFVVGFVKGWKLTLVILAVSPLLALSSGFIARIGATFTTKELGAYAKAGAVAEEVFGAIRTVVAFGGQKKESERYNRNLLDAMAFGIRKGMVNGGGIGLVFLVIFSTYALAFWYGTKLIREDGYSGGDLLVVFFCVLIGAFSLGNAAPNMQYFSNARGAAYTIYGIIDQVPSIDNERTDGIQIKNLIGNIEFRNVKFNYPSRPEVPILQGLNLKVEVGHTVALVGASGCGKSTTVQLIQRFYDPLEGQVLIDGVDVKDLNLKWLRQNIGIVSQEPVLFGTTIAENIRYGWDGVTQEQIEAAAKKANAHNFIMNFPDKYETLVGERGAQMSGGQKQRIAIARALVKDPKILLLDEATSALDTESEATVQAALDSAREGRTTIVIAHRLSTIKTADQIAGFDNGVVAELGSHNQLMDLGKIYYTLVMNQTKPTKAVEAGLDGEEDMDEVAKAVVEKYSRQESTDQKARAASFKRQQSAGSTGRDRTTSEAGAAPLEEEEEKLSPPSLSRIIKLNAPEWFPIVIGCVSAIISGSIQPLFALTMSEILSTFSETDPVKMQEQTNTYCIFFAIIGVVAGTAMFLQSSMFAYSGEKLTLRLRERTFIAMLQQEIGWFDDRRHNTGALTTRLATDASAVKGATGQQLAVVLQSIASIGIGITIGFIYSAKLAAVILAFGPFIMISGFVQMRILQGNTQKDKELLEEAGKVAVEGIENIRTVASLTKETTFYNKYVEYTSIPYRENKKKVHAQGIAWGISQGIIFFAYAVCFKYGSHLVRYEGLSYGDMYKVFMAIVFSAMSVGQASSFAPDYGKAKTGASLIFTIWDRKPEIDSEDSTGEIPEKCTGVVTFEDVKFHYPTRPDVRVLRGLNIGVSPGQTLALVGSSGCGKSTSVLLTERFYDPTGGVVRLDNHDVKSVQLSWLRQQIGIVSQEPTLFDCSIRENIEYGDNSRHVAMDEVIQAARQANIHDFISSLPMGYDTNVGDRGAQLSGGQKQRIAIARALVRNPKILLLDEATSALDTESEKVVQEALDRAQQGRTCIVIAHRLSTIRDADCIAVIHNGTVAEKGTHDELMALKGLYYRLNKVQERQV